MTKRISLGKLLIFSLLIILICDQVQSRRGGSRSRSRTSSSSNSRPSYNKPNTPRKPSSYNPYRPAIGGIPSGGIPDVPSSNSDPDFDGFPNHPASDPDYFHNRLKQLLRNADNKKPGGGSGGSSSSNSDKNPRRNDTEEIDNGQEASANTSEIINNIEPSENNTLLESSETNPTNASVEVSDEEIKKEKYKKVVKFNNNLFETRTWGRPSTQSYKQYFKINSVHLPQNFQVNGNGLGTKLLLYRNDFDEEFWSYCVLTKRVHADNQTFVLKKVYGTEATCEDYFDFFIDPCDEFSTIGSYKEFSNQSSPVSSLLQFEFCCTDGVVVGASAPPLLVDEYCGSSPAPTLRPKSHAAMLRVDLSVFISFLLSAFLALCSSA